MKEIIRNVRYILYVFMGLTATVVETVAETDAETVVEPDAQSEAGLC